MPEFIARIALLLHLGAIPALLVVVACLPFIKRSLYADKFIHSDFEYYYNPLIIIRYIRAKIVSRQPLPLSIWLCMLAAGLVLLDCLIHQTLRLLY